MSLNAAKRRVAPLRSCRLCVFFMQRARQGRDGLRRLRGVSEFRSLPDSKTPRSGSNRSPELGVNAEAPKRENPEPRRNPEAKISASRGGWVKGGEGAEASLSLASAHSPPMCEAMYAVSGFSRDSGFRHLAGRSAIGPYHFWLTATR